ncbi:MAG TPA: deoxyribonuclease IV [Gemmatimonadales bacterium]|jgi:deoxyribonuclease-4|nr:deoxyribonuclease IV [Gemmatimonadales bacterium]
MPPVRKQDLLGAHVSAQGGVHATPARATAIGATAIQLFTKTPNQWREPSLDGGIRDAFHSALEAESLTSVVSHDSYLINLASPDPVLRDRSIESFIRELERCELLGIPGVVSHPGNYMDDRDRGLERNANAIRQALERVPGQVRIYLETTAGAGTALGRSFEELARIRDLLPPEFQGRIAYCADTCHLYSAGYDLVGNFDEVWSDWDRVIGLEHLACLHLNDSRTPFGSRRDRHELIGEGSLGPAPFRRLMLDPRFARIPKILETPKGDDMVTNDRRTLQRLRRYARSAR